MPVSANASFHIPLATEPQDQSAFTREGQRWTLQVPPQGYLHGPSRGHRRAAEHLSLSSFPHQEDGLITLTPYCSHGNTGICRRPSCRLCWGASEHERPGSEPIENSRPRHCH